MRSPGKRHCTFGHAGALLAAALLLTSVAASAPLCIALIPPRDHAPTLSQARAAAAALSIAADDITPEELVSPAFNPDKYPLAIYTGGERYCYTVATPGDGAAALLRYVRQGGVLLVAGKCWPFYRPVDYVDGEWVAGAGSVPEFEGDVDPHLLAQMRALNQTSVGSFNRYLGLNIAGEGTEEFEAPEERIEFVAGPGEDRFPSLPDRFPFPSGGDARFRPASPRHGLPGATFEAAATAVGESGREYGPGIAIIRHAEGGMVIYIWGSLMEIKRADALMRDVLLLAARETAGPQDRATIVRLRQETRDLTDRNKRVGDALAQAAEDMPARGYLIRENAFLASRLDTVGDTILVRNFAPAREKLRVVAEALARLEGRAEALAR